MCVGLYHEVLDVELRVSSPGMEAAGSARKAGHDLDEWITRRSICKFEFICPFWLHRSSPRWVETGEEYGGQSQ